MHDSTSEPIESNATPPRGKSPLGVVFVVAAIAIGAAILFRGFGGQAAPTPEYLPVTTDLASVDLSGDMPVVAVVTADWCGPCQKLKKDSLADEGVRTYLEGNARTVMIDGTDTNDPTVRASLEALQVTAFPSTIVLRDGKPAAMLRGYAGPEKYRGWLEANLN
ncbi:MAG: thioredoxin family protein [Planctomycetota bacterium]